MLRGTALAILLLLAAGPAYGRDALTIGLNEAAAYPYIAGEGAALGDPPGLAVEILRAVASRLDIDVRFIRMPGQRVLSELRSGRLDGALMYSHTPEREAFGAYPMRDGRIDPLRRLATLSYTLYRLRGSALDWSGERFLNLTGPIGANLNYSIVQDLREMGVDVTELRTTADSFRMLLARRVDGVADHSVVADIYLAAAGIVDVEKVGPALREKDYHLLLSHQYASARPERAEAIWSMIGELRDPLTVARMPIYLDKP